MTPEQVTQWKLTWDDFLFLTGDPEVIKEDIFGALDVIFTAGRLQNITIGYEIILDEIEEN